MKKNLLLATVLVMIASVGYSTRYTIGNSGTTFSPATITIHVGDTVVFTLASAHDAIEVSKATYDTNGNTTNGGFSVPFGGGQVIFHNAGTFYFVCEPHAALGMKGIITVTTAAGIEDANSGSTDVKIFPDPASNYLRIGYSLAAKEVVTITLINSGGKIVADILSATREPGAQEDTYEINNLLSGLYFVNIQYGGHSLVK